MGVTGFLGYLGRKVKRPLREWWDEKRRAFHDLEAKVTLLEIKEQYLKEVLGKPYASFDDFRREYPALVAQAEGYARERIAWQDALRRDRVDEYVNGHAGLPGLAQRLVRVSVNDPLEHAYAVGRSRAAVETLESILQSERFNIEVSTMSIPGLEKQVEEALIAYNLGQQHMREIVTTVGEAERKDDPWNAKTPRPYHGQFRLSDEDPIAEKAREEARRLMDTIYKPGKTLYAMMNGILARRKLTRRMKALLMAEVIRRKLREGDVDPHDFAQAVERYNNYVAKYGKEWGDEYAWRIEYADTPRGEVVRIYQPGIDTPPAPSERETTPYTPREAEEEEERKERPSLPEKADVIEPAIPDRRISSSIHDYTGAPPPYLLAKSTFKPAKKREVEIF